MTQGLPENLAIDPQSSQTGDDLETLHAFEVAKIGVWTKIFLNNRNSTNSILYELLDLDDSEPFDMRRVISQCLHADDRTLLEDALDTVVNPLGHGAFSISFRVMKQDHSIRWISMDAHVVFEGEDDAKTARSITAVCRDITARKETDAHNRVLIAELNHRVKSILTLVQSVAYQTFRYDVGSSGLFTDFQGRLRALGKAHDLLVESRFHGAFIEPLVDRILSGCGAPTNRMKMTGFPLHLGSKQAVSLSVILHELSVNSLKYGAFSLPLGRVELNWMHNLQSNMVRMQWIEIDGPPVIEPTEKGFGSRMIERAIALEFGGGVTMDYAPDGLRCTMTIPFKSFDRKADE